MGHGDGYTQGPRPAGGFVGIAVEGDTPDHSTISRTRRWTEVETRQEVFARVLGVFSDRGIL